jgi:hypothetical protein
VVTPALIRYLFAFGFEPVPKLLPRGLEPWQRCNFRLIQQAGTAASEGIKSFEHIGQYGNNGGGRGYDAGDALPRMEAGSQSARGRTFE